MGVVGLSYDDFCRLEIREFRAVCKAFQEQREADVKNDWERMRLLATIVIQPHVKGKMKPEKLLPLPWDKPKTPKAKNQKPAITRAEDKARFEALIKRLGE